jgi:hypothetical protein
MGLKLTEENAKKAFGEVLACTGIGSADGGCDALLPEKVLVRIPASMHSDYPARLLAGAIRVCSHNPYGWRVQQEEPTIAVSTTFQSLWDDWFRRIVY